MDDAYARGLLDLARETLARVGEPEVELSLRVVRRGLARFANNAIGQHQDVVETEASVRVARDGRLGQASTTRLDADSLKELVESAAVLAQSLPKNEEFRGFAHGDGTPRIACNHEVDSTAQGRAEALAPWFSRAQAESLSLAGTLGTRSLCASVATTTGVSRAAHVSHAAVRCFATDRASASGFGAHTTGRFRELSVERAVSTALDRCRRSKDPLALEPGTYDVVLEPAAVAELVEWMAMASFGAREVEQGTSFLTGRAGERITSESITLRDEPTRAFMLGTHVPFDREGTTSETVTFVDRGVARGPVFDRTYAARLGQRSTGHAALVDGELAPSAQALVLEPGTSTADELLAGIDRGLHISKLHYVNGLLEPRRAVMTGLTRDGTFLVEHGRPTRAVHNLRFTDAFLDAFARIDGIGKVLEAVPGWWSDAVLFVPAVRLRGLRFTGSAHARA